MCIYTDAGRPRASSRCRPSRVCISIYLSLSLYIYIYIYVYVCIYIYIYICVYAYIYIYIYIYMFTHVYINSIFIYIMVITIILLIINIYAYMYTYIIWPRASSRCRPSQRGLPPPASAPERQLNITVSFHNFKSQNLKLSVSNPKSKYAAYLSVLSRISNCQSLGRKNKHEILKADRMFESNPPKSRILVRSPASASAP